MVLRLKTRESRSLPGLPNATNKSSQITLLRPRPIPKAASKAAFCSSKDYSTSKSIAVNAGWSSPVARQAHNLKAAGSNPAPATKCTTIIKTPRPKAAGGFGVYGAAMTASQSVRREIDRIVSIGPINAMLVELCLVSALKLVQLLISSHGPHSGASGLV